MNYIHRSPKKPVRTALAVLALAAIPAVAPLAPTTATTTAAATGCPRGWGSLPEASNRTSTAHLRNIRSGRHACFDRLVLDLDGKAAGYRVSYVSAVRMDGSGRLVPLRGGARIQLIVTVPDHDTTGRLTYRPANRRELVNVAGYSTLRQVAWAGSFEGQTTLGIGVRARLPFRTFTLPGPTTTTSRVVLDIAHHW